jgi:L-ribulose-5-phosphate 4-epimerase
MNEEGVIKFKSRWNRKPALDLSIINDLNACRQSMFRLGLIGCTEDGIGYGNISKRFEGNTFIISGSGTGGIELTNNLHYTVVTSFDIDENSLTAEGPIIASSESLTHAMLYKCHNEINAVIHVHHHALWQKLMSVSIFTSVEVEYGTPAMAREIEKITLDPQIKEKKIFAMGGHQDGIIAFGNNLFMAEKIITGHLELL